MKQHIKLRNSGYFVISSTEFGQQIDIDIQFIMNTVSEGMNEIGKITTNMKFYKYKQFVKNVQEKANKWKAFLKRYSLYCLLLLLVTVNFDIITLINL